LLPVYLIKLDFFGVPTNALEVLMALVVAWAFFLKRSFGKFLKLRFRMALGLTLAGLAASTLVNKSYLVGAGIVKGWFLLPFLFALAAKSAVLAEKKENIFLAYYFSALAAAAISLAYYFFGAVTFDGRLQTFFNSPNYLAMFLAPAIIIGTVQLGREKENKKILAASLGITGAAFYLTYSYAAWAAVVASLVITGLTKLFSVKNSLPKIGLCKKLADFAKVKKTFLLVGLAILLAVIFLQADNEKFKDAINLKERSSLSSRMMIWRSAGAIIQDNWLWGIGSGNFQNKYLEYQKHFPPYLEWAVPHPHNLFLALWLSGGLSALLGFIALVVLWLREIFRQEKNALWLASLGIMLYFLLHGLLDTTYFKNDLAAIFWLNFFMLL
jgi:O-antigen ligase